jgi:hypothetical protein
MRKPDLDQLCSTAFEAAGKASIISFILVFVIFVVAAILSAGGDHHSEESSQASTEPSLD